MFFSTQLKSAYHYGVIPLIIKLLSRLSLKNLQRLGSSLGILAYIGSSRYRALLNTHLLQAAKLHNFEPHPWMTTKAAGMMLTDSLWIWHHPQEALSLTKVLNWDVVQEAIAEGRGLVMLAPHFGAFEMIPRVLAEHFPATILYRPARQSWLNEIIEKGRAHPRMTFAPANMQGVRQLARALQRGEAVGILPDQVPSVGDGVWAKFFGEYAYTVVLPAKIASRNNVPTVIFTARRLGLGEGWEMTAERMQNPFSADPIIAASQLNQLLETAILKCPDQYLWGYNRYKHPAGADLPPTKE